MTAKDEVYEVYLRDTMGGTFYLPLREGLGQFLGPDGYRLTLNIEGITIVLRRDTTNDADITLLDDALAQVSVECLATVKGIIDE